MYDPSENGRNISTPERKRKFTERWIQESCATNSINSNVSQNSPTLGRKRLAVCSPPISPTLQRESLSSPVIGTGKRILKRKRVVKKLDIAGSIEKSNPDLQTEKLKKKVDNNKISNENLIFDKDDELLPNTFSEIYKTFNSSATTMFDESADKKKLQKNVLVEDFVNATSYLGEKTSSQLIESTSSETKLTQDTAINIEEIDSETDKTESDFIEEVKTQISASLNISSPSTSSTEKKNNINFSGSIHNETDEFENFLKISTPSDDIIESINTLESKVNFSKTSYILQYTKKTPKKRRNPKKGSLLDNLLVAMKKERSAVNILRHQLSRRPTDSLEKSFILLQIIQHLPMINDDQLLKCMLIEDSVNLLSDKLKKTTYLYVINVPEVSSLINISEKPILKVYEPWILLDSKQSILHITRFTAMSNDHIENFDNIGENSYSIDLKIKNEFSCLCINEKVVTSNCKAKLGDTQHTIIKRVFDYK